MEVAVEGVQWAGGTTHEARSQCESVHPEFNSRDTMSPLMYPFPNHSIL